MLEALLGSSVDAVAEDGVALVLSSRSVFASALSSGAVDAVGVSTDSGYAVRLIAGGAPDERDAREQRAHDERTHYRFTPTL